jgi:hypothetical protein
MASWAFYVDALFGISHPGFENEIQGVYPDKGKGRPGAPVHLRDPRVANRRNSSGRTSSPQRCMSPGPGGTSVSCGV